MKFTITVTKEHLEQMKNKVRELRDRAKASECCVVALAVKEKFPQAKYFGFSSFYLNEEVYSSENRDEMFQITNLITGTGGSLLFNLGAVEKLLPRELTFTTEK